MPDKNRTPTTAQTFAADMGDDGTNFTDFYTTLAKHGARVMNPNTDSAIFFFEDGSAIVAADAWDVEGNADGVMEGADEAASAETLLRRADVRFGAKVASACVGEIAEEQDSAHEKLQAEMKAERDANKSKLRPDITDLYEAAKADQAAKKKYR